jgi:hypothetical protein
VLLEIAGRRILTDPVWGDRASPTRRLGPRRFQPVPVALDGLPAVDLVLLSHDHYDHLDYPTIRALRRSTVPFLLFAGRQHVADLIRQASSTSPLTTAILQYFRGTLSYAALRRRVFFRHPVTAVRLARHRKAVRREAS